MVIEDINIGEISKKRIKIIGLDKKDDDEGILLTKLNLLILFVLF